MGSAFYNGLPSGVDLQQHYQFAAGTYGSISAGEMVPSLAPLANNGLGDYGIRLYPPLSYVFISLVFGVTGSWYFASLISFLLIFWLGGIGTYLWAKEELPERQALLAAALFTFAPYHLNQIYNSFLFAEFAASAVIPFCLLFILRITKRGRLVDIAGLSVTFGLLILTHLPSIILCAFTFGVYSLILLYKHKTFFPTLLKLAGSVVLSLVVSAFYWIKVVTELNWSRHTDSKYFSDVYSYHENFLTSIQHFIDFRDDIRALWLAELMLLSVFVICIPSFVYLFRNWKKASLNNIAHGAIVLLAVFLTSGLSEFVWDYVPLMEKVQFPWRWLGIVMVFGAVFAADGIIRASDSMNAKKNWLLTIALSISFLIFLTTSFVIMKSGLFMSKEDFSNERVSQISAAKSYESWWTIWMKTPLDGKPDQIYLRGRDAQVVAWRTDEKEFVIKEGPPEKATIALYYYPHWKAFVNEKPAKIAPSESGLITIDVGKELSRVRLKFVEPTAVIAAWYVSLAGVLIILASLISGFWVSRYRKQPDPQSDIPTGN